MYEMADEDEVVSANNNEEVFVYMGGNMVVPDDVVRAQVHPSVTVIPDSTVCTVHFKVVKIWMSLICVMD